MPDTLDELVTLPGVARKTANVILTTWFKKDEGVVVDTHVGRLSERMALTWRSKNSKDAVKIERDLMDVIPPRQWGFFGHAMIWHGRRVCSAQRSSNSADVVVTRSAACSSSWCIRASTDLCKQS